MRRKNNDRKAGIVKLKSNLEMIEVYSVDVVQEKYEISLKTKVQELKISNNIDLFRKIEYKLIKEKKIQK